MGFINSTFSLHLVKHPIPCLLLNFSDWELGKNGRSLIPLLIIILTIAKQYILSHWITRSPLFYISYKQGC